MEESVNARPRRELIGQKSPFKLKDIWAVRIRLQMSKHIRDLALFNLAIDSKLRGCFTLRVLSCRTY